MPYVAASAALLLSLAAAAPAHGPWILTCNMGGPERVFRIGRQLLQEWRPEKSAFGPNLCASFRCIGSPDRLEGVISSPSLSVTLTLDLASGAASWRALGASNLRTNNGPCTVRADRPTPAG